MNQRPFRTLILWLIWAATAIVVYVALYRDTNVWSFIERDPSRITWLIISLFGFGMVISFSLTVMITREAYRSQKIDDQAREGGVHAIQIPNTEKAVDRFFDALKSTIDTKGTPEVETLIGIELAFFERLSHTVEVVGNILITLGLIGTVMGLTLTLTGLNSSLEALGNDQEMLVEGLRQAMSGMGTAFYTTLLGAVLGGVLLRMFAQITQHGVEGLHDGLLRLCLVYCSKDYAPSMERDVRLLNAEVKALEHNMQQLEKVFGSSQSVLNQFREELQRLGVSDQKGAEPLHELLARHRSYCDMLRKEMHMLAHMDRPWYIKLREVFRPAGKD